MLPILQDNSILTMTTREIADLTDKRHDNVFNVCEKLIELGVLEFRNPMIYTHPQNHQQYDLYVLKKRDSLILAGRLSPEFMAKIFDRWQELENQQPKHILPQSFAEALQLAANQAAQLEAAKPAIEFVERYAKADGLKGFREVCKLLGAKENVFRDFLVHKRVMYRLNGTWTAYAEHIDAGRFEIKTGLSETEHSFNQAMFTAKGVAWVSQLWSDK